MENYENYTPDQEPKTEAPIEEETVLPQEEPAPVFEIPTELDPPTYVLPQPKKNQNGWKVALSAFFIIALVVASCGATAWLTKRQIFQELTPVFQDIAKQIKANSFTGNGNSISGTPNVSADGMTPAQVYAKCAGSVVAIEAASTNVRSSGSGFILTPDGYIMTNYHVVQDSTLVTVTLHDGTTHTAGAVGYDDTHDIALLKIDGTDLPAVTLGNSKDLIVGDQVAAIGNPLGILTSTLTVGVVSAKERDVTTDGTIINMLQTDAAINSGNSGGPLFNMKGEVVGITTAKYSGTTSSGATIEGICFAIPIDDVKDKIQQIKTNGYVSTPYMGVSVDNRNEGFGAYVVSVEQNSAAAAAGIQVDDLIMAIGEQDVTSVELLTKTLKSYKVGDTTTVTVLRGRKIMELTITFGEKPKDTTMIPTENTQVPSSSPNNTPNIWDWIFGNN